MVPESIVAMFVVVKSFHGLFSSEEVAPECIAVVFIVELLNSLNGRRRVAKLDAINCTIFSQNNPCFVSCASSSLCSDQLFAARCTGIKTINLAIT